MTEAVRCITSEFLMENLEHLCKKKEKKIRGITLVHSHERHPLIPLTLTEMIYLSH